MLSMLISSIVLASFMLVSKGFNLTSKEFQQDIRGQIGIRSFIELISMHASQAGYQPPDSTFATGIKSMLPFLLNGSSTTPGVQADVSSIRFVFDTGTNLRDYALYAVQPNVRNGRTEKKIVLNHYYLNTSNTVFSVLGNNNANTAVDVLLSVKDFKCSFRNISGTPRALDCYLSVYKDLPPNTATLDYEFTLATTQSF